MTKTAILTAIIACMAFLGANAQGQGKVAILPFTIVSNEAGLTSDAMSNKIQLDCATSFEKNTSLDVQPTRTTNSILAKNNIRVSDLAAAAPNDLATMLNVDYVVFGTTEIQNKGTSTSGSNVSSYNDKSKKENDDNDRKSKGTSYSSSSSSTSTNYQTHLSLEIYNSAGNKEYSASREPFGGSTDSYKNGLDYMVKRTPFGSKHK